MIIEKGTKVRIISLRKGTYIAIAYETFDTEDDWYSLVIAEEQKFLQIMGKTFLPGEEIPCRANLCQIGVLPEKSINSDAKEVTGNLTN